MLMFKSTENSERVDLILVNGEAVWVFLCILAGIGTMAPNK